MHHNHAKPAAALITALLMATGLTGCVTLSGTYVVSATTPENRDLAPNLRVTADGNGIYAARNALCSAHPGATILIKDLQTGEELKSESPYTCKSK